MKRTPLSAACLLAALALTPAVRPDEAPAAPSGATALFNGKDLTGWKVVGGKPGSWGAENGLLYTVDGGGWLMTEKEYDNFELRLDFKVPVNGNSGVGLRSPLAGDPAYVGMEIQILDDGGPAYKTLQPFQYCGSLYGVVAAKKKEMRPVGEWNSYRIVADGRKLTIELNGEKLVDTDLDSHKDKEKSHPGLLRTTGHLGLQSHGGRVEFRNVFVKPLGGQATGR